ncbi:hypothetical protein SAMN02982994_1247 [Azospirillum lipoferum]|nr:hypothetical protein SAMN02982994_1247 [Azospirillum lipoferum]
MTALFRSIEGRCPHGSDLLREHMRWEEAERRWHPAARHGPPHHSPPQGDPPPACLPPDHASLPRGALLTRFTTACAAAGASAL